MKRTSFASKRPVREPRADRSAEFASVVIDRPRAVMATRLDAPRPAPVRAVEPKTPGRMQQSIRDAARGEPCTVRIVGACNHNPETSVWSHWPGIDAGRGMGMKAIDLAGCISCSACHDVVDGRAPLPPGASRESVLLDWFRGHMRSLVLLKKKGIV